MTDWQSIGVQARRLLLRAYHGVLSTHSVDVPGYPFGSVVPYCLDRAGEPVILISRIAQHTKNIKANAKVSLIAADDQADDVQAAARLTLLADAVPLVDEREAIAARYYKYFPNSRNYHATHDFDFYRLALVRARYIGGFGEIYWLQPSDLLLANPFASVQELHMIRHMNEDHIEAMRHYCRQAGVHVHHGTEPTLAGIDAEGFHLRVGARIVRFEFSQMVGDTQQVRAALVAMARRD